MVELRTQGKRTFEKESNLVKEDLKQPDVLDVGPGNERKKGLPDPLWRDIAMAQESNCCIHKEAHG